MGFPAVLTAKLKHVGIGFIVLALASCTTLQSLDLPEEKTSAPVEAGIWTEIEDVYAGDWQIPLNDGSAALEWRLRSIDAATASIDMQTFLWSFDTVGTAVMSRLVAAADRGVKVKLLIDDSFLAGEDKTVLSLQEHPNIEYRIYNPFERRSNGLVSRQILNLGEFERLDHRMHNKAMIVDNQIAIVGGRNIADEYFGFDSQSNFRDMELLVGGPVVQQVAQVFDDYWNDDWSFPADRVIQIDTAAVLNTTDLWSRQTNPLFQYTSATGELKIWRRAVRQSFTGRTELVADKPPSQSPAALQDQPIQVSNRLLKLLGLAQKDITIVSAYLIPSPAVTGALRAAVDRGVDVTILTNSIRSNNHLAAYSAYKNHKRDLLTSGVELHEMRIDAQSRFRYILAPVAEKNLALHAKYLIVDDDLVFIGSANLDPRSLRLNTEMGLIVQDRRLNRELRAYTAPDLDTKNAWRLELDSAGDLFWIGDKEVLKSEPEGSFMRRVEDWFFAHLPIEDEL